MPFHHVDNIRLYYELLGEGEQTIVFLNGVMMSTESWLFQTPEFSKRYRVLLHDFRGQGRSSGPDEPYTFDQHCQELKSLLDALGIRQAHFIGTSYGSEVGMMFAVNHPEYIQSLTICAGVSESNALLRAHIDSWCVAARHAIEHNTKDDFMFSCAPLNYSAGFLEQNPGFVAERAKMVAQLPDSWFASLIRLCECFNTFDITAQLHRIKAPVLLISGSEDILKGPPFAALMKAQMPHAESLIVMGAGHAMVIEKAAEFNSLVMGFIDRHCAIAKNLLS